MTLVFAAPGRLHRRGQRSSVELFQAKGLVSDARHQAPVGYREALQVHLSRILLHHHLPFLPPGHARHAASVLSPSQGAHQFGQRFLPFPPHHEVGHTAAHQLLVEEGGVKVPQYNPNTRMPLANGLHRVLDAVHGKREAGKPH